MQIMENREIEEMRSQISLLRNKLEKQQIINDTVVAAAIKNNIAGIERKIRLPLLAGLFALAYCPFAFVRLLNVSVPFVVFTELIIVFSLVETYCQMRMIPTAADRGSDIADFVRRLDKFDRLRKRQLMSGMIMITVFFVWLLKDLSANYDAEEFYGLLSAVSIGLVAGLVIGLKNYFGISRRLRDLRRDAEVLRQE